MQNKIGMLRRSWLMGSLAGIGYGSTSRIETFHKEHVLGTALELQVDGEGAEDAFKACCEEVERLRRILSTYDDSSVISRWRESGQVGRPAGEAGELLSCYEAWGERSGGVIAHQIQGRLDVNALGKSWIVDRALAAARAAAPKARGILLNIGGDIAVSGGAWSVGVADPQRWHENAPLMTTVSMTSGAVATSGGYERGASHLVDPRTGQGAKGARSATVFACDAVTANALSTALCVLGRQEGEALLQNFPQVQWAVVDWNGQTWTSSGMQPGRRLVSAAAWPKGQQLTITLTLRAMEGYRVRRPYVAVWAEDMSGKVVKTISVWTEKRRWLPDLYEWWKKAGSSGGGASVTRATRPPGRYQLRWDGLDDQGQPVGVGKYRIVVESNREHGSYAKESGVIECGANAATVKMRENGEFEAVELSYGIGGQKA
jgi:thiamine biosynthesis lipoprotein